ncbi:hypothetical protein EK904_005932 [Melospiza melodia maxima]|nr:hypothetical protein EK904_005932 [Melospiza melodia maxima]
MPGPQDIRKWDFLLPEASIPTGSRKKGGKKGQQPSQTSQGGVGEEEDATRAVPSPVPPPAAPELAKESNCTEPVQGEELPAPSPGSSSSASHPGSLSEAGTADLGSLENISAVTAEEKSVPPSQPEAALLTDTQPELSPTLQGSWKGKTCFYRHLPLISGISSELCQQPVSHCCLKCLSKGAQRANKLLGLSPHPMVELGLPSACPHSYLQAELCPHSYLQAELLLDSPKVSPCPAHTPRDATFSLMTAFLLGAAEEVTAAQEAAAAVPEVPGATQGAGAASFPQENSGEDTQMLTAPSATQVLLATGASSTGSPVDAEGRILLQGHRVGWYLWNQCHTPVSMQHPCLSDFFMLKFCPPL